MGFCGEGHLRHGEKLKVLRVGLPIVENLSGLQESIFSLFRSPQLHFGQKSKKDVELYHIYRFSPVPPAWVPWAAVNGLFCQCPSQLSAAGVLIAFQGTSEVCPG